MILRFCDIAQQIADRIIADSPSAVSKVNLFINKYLLCALMSKLMNGLLIIDGKDFILIERLFHAFIRLQHLKLSRHLPHLITLT